MDIKVAQIAKSKVFVVRSTDSMVTVAQALKDKNIGSLIVLGKKDEVVGIVTERDVVKAAANKDLDSPVEKYMTKDIKGVTEDTSATESLGIMLDHGFRHLPIVGKDGKLRGIISIRDLARSLLDTHFMQFGKFSEEVSGTGVICPVCGLEIDEYGYCGCGVGSG
ncbi:MULTISPECIES: CBS domain-containing protein [Acidianus]|uniref:CBS domain-containing protein n=1 Tax=Candidatus Acidianus copahuensis TaxID=1160895 RepID=A0A031LLU1_9CREN|nr:MULTISPECIES: CBS domain-containing protein [Acidianus]EZQ01833.1 hypothetical protein CM19_12245 [Candidatus Acidianus copahuensis]NON62275.1 CBS domain-containing protein [Acidianus sp. RZ1]